MDVDLECHELHLSGSVGISLYPADGQDVQTLLRAADTAMYQAKKKGSGTRPRAHSLSAKLTPSSRAPRERWCLHN